MGFTTLLADGRRLKRLTALTIALLSVSIGASTAASGIRPDVYDGCNNDRVYLPLGDRAFVDEVIEYKLDKSKPPDHWRQTKAALGRPNYVSQLEDEESPTPSYVALGGGGSITFRFNDNALVDQPGHDLYVWEVRELAQKEEHDSLGVEISEDGKQWLAVGDVDYTNPRIDIAAVAKPGQLFHYVRLTDKSGLTKGEQFPGCDVDAVAAISSAPKVVIDDATLFTSEENNLSEAGVKQLADPSELIRVTNPTSIVVESHSDKTSQSDDTDVAELSKKRGELIQKYFVNHEKFPADNVKMESYGNSRPILPSNTKSGRERNSRVEIVMVPAIRETVITAKTPRNPEIIDGTWESNLGPVILVARKNEKGKIDVHGEWLPNQGRVGVIQGGTFNPDNGMLDVEWYQKWNNLRGTSKFQLSINGKKLRGTCKNDRNEVVDWVLARQE